MKYKPGQKYHARIPFSGGRKMLIHIDYVLNSIYTEDRLIIYRVYGKHKQYWHEFMCYAYQMDSYIKL